MAEKHLTVELIDPQKLIKVNELQEVTNPVFFVRDGVPYPDGLLSYEIFGISKDDRANRFAYIDLYDYFLNPLIYKKWTRMDSKIRDLVHGTKKFKITSSGELEVDENGETGLKFLKKNIDKIRIKSTDSSKRDINIKFIYENKDKMFIKQYIVIPAFYRDVLSNGGYVGVGDINKLYSNLIMSVRTLRETADYGIDMSDASRGRIQELILNIYNWLTKEPNIAGKSGILKRSILSKTADYGSRLVLSAPQLKVENLDDLPVDLDYCLVPLASLCDNLFPYIVFWVRRFFENEFQNRKYAIQLDNGNIEYITVKDPQIEFSDERIKKEMKRFMKGFSNRFIPIEIPNEEGIKGKYMYFKGNLATIDQATHNPEPKPELYTRRLTWCDLFFMAAVEMSQDKVALITRYPMDSYFNQFPMKIHVSSTKNTIPMYVNNTFYPRYPDIKDSDILTNTSNKFIDTLNITNLRLSSIGGDYDGDQVTVKIAFTREANEELLKHMNAKSNFINLGGKSVIEPTNEAIQSLYNLTLVLPNTTLTDPKFAKK